MKRQFLVISAIALFFLISAVLSSAEIASAEENIWYVYDVIEPSAGLVKWSEEGAMAEPTSWIADGSWSYASMRESLVGENDIFVSTYERFDWSRIRSNVENYYGANFGSFRDFEIAVQNDAGPWLELSWQMDVEWYGISSNTTKVQTSFNETSSQGEMRTWFHITRIPEYIVGQGVLENWLTGFDLTPVSIGSMKVWELYQDWSADGAAYRLYFEAPSSMLSQHGGNYTCNIGVSSYYQAYAFKIQQGIDINMPANTVIKEASPYEMSVNSSNTASFIVQRGDYYPSAFTVVSGPPVKSAEQAFLEGASLWLFTPPGWAAMASITVLVFTALRGRRIWRRSKLYHRLYKSMVTLYDMYSKDHARFRQEMETVSKTIFKMLVEDKVTDDQFERLLERRDDLLERADRLQPPPPPAKT